MHLYPNLNLFVVMLRRVGCVRCEPPKKGPRCGSRTKLLSVCVTTKHDSGSVTLRTLATRDPVSDDVQM